MSMVSVAGQDTRSQLQRWGADTLKRAGAKRSLRFLIPAYLTNAGLVGGIVATGGEPFWLNVAWLLAAPGIQFTLAGITAFIKTDWSGRESFDWDYEEYANQADLRKYWEDEEKFTEEESDYSGCGYYYDDLYENCRCCS